MKTPTELRGLLCKQMIEVIQYMLANAVPEESRGLWNVLTALRGPDFHDGDPLKLATTAIIRHRFLGRTDNIYGVMVRKDRANAVKLRIETAKYPDPRRHFISHAECAFVALGLTWNEHNDARPKRKGKKK